MPCSKTSERYDDFPMTDFIPKASEPKVRGLGPKAQKLQAMREKAAAQAKGGDKSLATSSTASSQGERLLRRHEEDDLPAQSCLAVHPGVVAQDVNST